MLSASSRSACPSTRLPTRYSPKRSLALLELTDSGEPPTRKISFTVPPSSKCSRPVSPARARSQNRRIGVMTLTSPALSGGRFGAAETNRPTSLCVAGARPSRARGGGTACRVSPGRDTGVNPGADDRSLTSSSGQLPWLGASAVSAVGASEHDIGLQRRRLRKRRGPRPRGAGAAGRGRTAALAPAAGRRDAGPPPWRPRLRVSMRRASCSRRAAASGLVSKSVPVNVRRSLGPMRWPIENR